MKTSEQKIGEHFTALKVGASVCQASGRVIVNAGSNGSAVECPVCHRVVKTKAVR